MSDAEIERAKKNEAFVAWLRDLKGRSFSKILFSVFVHRDSNEPALMEVEFYISNDKGQIVKPASDGESLELSIGKLEPFDMGADGKVELSVSLKDIDLTKTAGTIISASIVEDAFGDPPSRMVGAILGLSTNADLLLLNCGDELVATQDRSHPMLSGRKIRIVSLF